jgi:hypothetical protein
MRIEVLIIIITGLLMFNLYTEGKYLKLAFKWKNITKWPVLLLEEFLSIIS